MILVVYIIKVTIFISYLKTKSSINNLKISSMKKVIEMSKEELLIKRSALREELKAVNALLKDVSYDGYVSMSGFSERLGIKLSSMRSRYEIYCVRYGIEWKKFDGDKGYYFKEEDVVKVVDGVELKRMKVKK